MAAAASIPDVDLHLFGEGTHRRLYTQLGAQPGDDGTRFAVWAPAARAVHVVGDFDGWTGEHAHQPLDSSGVWWGSVDGAGVGTSYRYRITTAAGDRVDKSDPVGSAHHLPPSIDSVVADLTHDWNDAAWM